MLKTSSENEVCSPISDFGAKIKYSCVPNSCVVAALSNAARGLGFREAGSGQLQQPQQQQHLFATNQLYKMSNSIERPNKWQFIRTAQQETRGEQKPYP